MIKLPSKYRLEKKVFYSIFIFFVICSAFLNSASAQNDQSSIIGFEGDGASLTGTLLGDGQVVLAHFNELTGELRVNIQGPASWSTEVLGRNFGGRSSVSITATGSDLHLIAVNASTGSVTYFSRRSGVWRSEVIMPNGGRGRASIATYGADVWASLSDSLNRDLILARRVSGVWKLQALDSGPESVGEESSLAISPGGAIAVAYSDETNLVTKVASVSAGGGSWVVENLSYPFSQYLSQPSVRFLSDSTISVLSADVIQEQSVGGKGILHALKRPNIGWDMERVGFLGNAGRTGVYAGSGISAAFLSKRGSVSSISAASLGSTGIWSGRIAYSALDENFTNLFSFIDRTGLLQIFTRTLKNNHFFIRQVGAALSGTDALPPVQVNPLPPVNGSDTDGDGLSDLLERQLGTNPRLVDTDDDGISDGQEYIDQTDPLDRGNFLDQLGTKVCVPWHRRLSTSAAIELTNLSNSVDLNLTFTLFSNRGKVASSDTHLLASNDTFVLSISEFAKTSRLTYATLCAEYSGAVGLLSGRFVEDLRTSSKLTLRPRSSVSIKSSHLLDQPLHNARPGTQSLSYKLLPFGRTDKAVQNITLSNIEPVTVIGTIRSLDPKGGVKYSYKLKIPPLGTAVIRGHELRLLSAGKIDWTPTKSNLKVQLVLEQQIEERKKRVYEVSKLTRQEGQMR